MKKIFITSLALAASLSHAQINVTSDSGFGNNSIVELDPTLSGFLSYHFLNNKIIVQNYDVSTSTTTDSRITMLGANGTVDTTFGTSGSFSCPLSYGTSGFGDFVHNFGNSAMMMFSGKKFHYNGSLDQTYGTAGQTEIFNNEIYRKVLPNGNLLVRTTNSIYQFNPSGQLDSAFGTNGTMACNSTLYNYSHQIFSIHENYIPSHSDNSILEYESNSSSLRKLNYTTGNFDTGFGLNGSAQYNTAGGPSATIMKFFVMSDGSIINYLFEDGDSAVKFITKTLPGGMLDTSFGINGRLTLPASLDGTNLTYAQDFAVVNNQVVIPVLDDNYPRKIYLMSVGNGSVSTVNGQSLSDTGLTTQMMNPDDKIFVSAKDNYLYLMMYPRTVKRFVTSNGTLSVKEATAEADVQIINPFSNELQIHTDEKIKSTEVFDVSGRLLLKDSGSKNINTSKLQKGLYMIKITTQNDKVISKKGIKN